MFKVNKRDTSKTPLAYFTPCSSVSIVNFEYVIAGWVADSFDTFLVFKSTFPTFRDSVTEKNRFTKCFITTSAR